MFGVLKRIIIMFKTTLFMIGKGKAIEKNVNFNGLTKYYLMLVKSGDCLTILDSLNIFGGISITFVEYEKQKIWICSIFANENDNSFSKLNESLYGEYKNYNYLPNNKPAVISIEIEVSSSFNLIDKLITNVYKIKDHEVKNIIFNLMVSG